MEAIDPSDNQPPLDYFVNFLYEGLEGYVYLAAKDIKKDPKDWWSQKFFQYPQQKDQLLHSIKYASEKLSLEVYLAPAIFNKPDAKREFFKASNVVWTEFDENAPDWTDTNSPSLIIQSSGEFNQHVYWRLNEPVTSVDSLEDVNKRITYNMGADTSAWDAGQVLRPPDTYNFKRDKPVFLKESHDYIYTLDVFDNLAPAPESVPDDWELTVLPDVDTVILKYAYTPDLIKLIKAERHEIKDRSTSLMNVAYACAQMQMSNNEIMAILLLCDDRWEKFKDRLDRMQRLAQIINIAKNKHPDQETDASDYHLMAFGFETFLDIDINIEWVIEPMLMEQGSMLLVGPGGIGKTQVMLQIAIHLALGKDWLHYKVKEPRKIALLSLEMGHGELKIFVEAMRAALTDEEAALLEQNLIIMPYGEPLHLNTPLGQAELISMLDDIEPDGLMVDSIGSAINGNISSDENVQPLTLFNDKIRKKYECFVFYIHHLRKSGDGKPNQDDVYGNQYLFNRSTSTYAVLRAKNGLLRFSNFKNRLAPLEKDHLIRRTETLGFESASHEIDELVEHLTDNNDKPEAGPFSL